MTSDSIYWRDALALEVVRGVSRIIESRFGAPPAIARSDGEWVSGPAASAACALTATSAARAAAHPTPTGCAAHAVEIAAPLREGGHFRGCLYAAAAAKDDVALLADLLALAADAIVSFIADTPSPAIEPGEGEGLAPRYAYEGILGRSSASQTMYRMLDKVIDSDATVLVQGENGTGKELVARAIHFNSRRRGERFVVQNCSAFNDNLLDSELFGHKRGAFTGAIADKQGLFEVADRGTFFLDEVGDMTPALQVKLLRVLQEGTFTPVGDNTVRTTDVRIIAATHRDLRRMVERGEFREDLFYRINVINVIVPPLRERREDVPLLVEHFLRGAARSGSRPKRLTRACMDLLVDYAWPGNIRELENEMARAAVLAGDAETIGPELLSPRVREPAAHGAGDPSLDEAVDAFERKLVVEALDRARGNRTHAAARLGISRRNLLRKIDKYGLEARRRDG